MQATVSGALDAVYRLCIWASGLAIAVMSLIVPWGVFARYVLERLGTSQRVVHAALAAHVAAGQRAGFVRAVDPARAAAMLLSSMGRTNRSQ